MTNHWNEDLARLLPFAPAGADSVELSAAMINFLAAWKADPRSDGDLDAAVVEIGTALNWDLGDARRAFDRFRLEATEESLSEFKSGFVGSKQLLLFGHVVGEVLDVPAVFAALLSPTGGMVGPGGASFHVRGGVLGYHGVAHDAGGYLCRKHSVAPGYEYVNEHDAQPCEDRPLAGQISGIAFWFKLLNLGWLSFLAVSDPLSGSPAASADISSLLEPGPLSTADVAETDEAAKDGVTLNQSELRFLQVVISGEFDPLKTDLIAQGAASLQSRGLVTGGEQEGYEISDQLIMATAIFQEPQLLLEVAPAGVGAEERAFSFYKWGDYIVEQTTPAPGQIRLAGLRDAGHAQERLIKVIPLAESNLAEISLSLTEDEFETAVSTAAAGEIEGGPGLGLDTTVPGAAADLTSALASGQVVGHIQLRHFKGRTMVNSRDLQFHQGQRGVWLVSRDTQLEDQVELSLANPTTIGQKLGL